MVSETKMLNRTQDSQLVSALARGIGILNCFTTQRQELSSREIAEATGLPKPTLFRLLDTLCELGLLRFSERVSKYVPGVTLLNLSAPALSRMTIRQLARPFMQDLADHIHGQVQILVGYRNTLTFAEIVHGVDSKIYRPEVGMRVSISRTASGRAYLCSMKDKDRKTYLDGFATDDPERQRWLQARLQDASKDLSQHGFCRGHGDLYREITTIAVPMQQTRDDEQWIFAISVPVFSQQSQHLDDDIGPRLISLVRNVEASLGTVA